MADTWTGDPGKFTEVRSVLREFLTGLSDRVSNRDFEHLLYGKLELDEVELGYKPEAYTGHNLVYPLLEAVGLRYQLEPRSKSVHRDRWPDFEITNTGIPYIGEMKPMNRAEVGAEDIKEYLGIEGFESPYGILTDGVDWHVYGPPESGGHKSTPTERNSLSLSDSLQMVASADGLSDFGSFGSTNSHGVAQIEKFATTFSPDRLDSWALEQMTRDHRHEFLKENRSLQSSLDGNWE